MDRSPISYSSDVHTPDLVYVQGSTTCTRMLTERACREINLDIGRRLPAVDRSRDRWIIDRYLERQLVQHVRARVLAMGSSSIASGSSSIRSILRVSRISGYFRIERKASNSYSNVDESSACINFPTL